MLLIFTTLVEYIPLILLIAVLLSITYFVFVDRSLRTLRVSMVAAYMVGLLLGVMPLLGHSASSQVTLGFSEWISPFSLLGVVVFGLAGFLLTWGAIKGIQALLVRRIPQVALLSLVTFIVLSLFYYLFGTQATARTISVLLWGATAAVLAQVLRRNTPSWRDLPEIYL